MRERVKPLYQPIPANQIYSHLQRIQDLEYRYTAYTCYLFGLRITEALSVEPKHFKTEELNGQKFYKVIVATLKNKKQPIRNPVAWTYGTEGEMAKELYNYLGTLNPSKTAFKITRQMAWHKFNKIKIEIQAITHTPRRLFTHTRGLFPHYLRHCRASHLVDTYGFNDIQLMFYMGWSDPKLATTYVKTDWKIYARQGANFFIQPNTKHNIIT